MVIDWLEPVDSEDDPWGYERPKRPDLPILRNFSYTKWHAVQMGFFFALLSYWGIVIGRQETVFILLAGVAQYIKGHRDKKNPDKTCNHNAGFHDVKEKPWYFATTFGITFILSSILSYLLLGISPF